MAESQEPGFLINAIHYPMPSAFRVGDPMLVQEITGMEFPEFAAAIDDEDRRKNPVILAGLIGVAIWQRNPKFSRAKVVSLVERLQMDDIDFVGDAEVDTTVPPTVAAEGLDESS
jgi:hypothetical protein